MNYNNNSYLLRNFGKANPAAVIKVNEGVISAGKAGAIARCTNNNEANYLLKDAGFSVLAQGWVYSIGMLHS